MLTEREIEERLKANIASLYGTESAPTMIGAWDVAQPGEVKGRGDASSTVIAVSVGLRQYASFCTPQADFHCATVLSVRRDSCPTGAALAALIEPLMNLFHRWNEDCDSLCDDMETQSFHPGGMQLNGGQLEQSEDGWTVTIDFILRGIVNVTTGN